MKRLARRFLERLRSERTGYTAYAALAAVTVAAVGFSEMPTALPSLSNPPPAAGPIEARGSDGLTLTGRLSQTKLVQGENGSVYLDLDLQAPALAGAAPTRKATDVIVVLDHSGSMAAENRLPFAKQAVVELLGRLTPEDRFALVVFDSLAAVASEPTPVTDRARERLIQTVRAIQPGSGTNLGDGILKAEAIAPRADTERGRRVLLLSDGEANEGITSPIELGGLARGMSEHGLILSTIGMGLGFNESLMSTLADHGMGTYAFLEHLGGLAEILSRNLDDSRNVYAEKSELEIRLAPGVALLDAGAYPIAPLSPGLLRVPIGQVLGGARRGLTLTFHAPTGTIGATALATVRLRYQTATGPATLELGREKLTLAVLPPERRPEARASVDEPVMKSSWLANNLGRLKSAYRDAVASGDRGKAEAAIDAYQREAETAEGALGMSILDGKTRSDLKTMERDLDDAFAGPPATQAQK
ncbi:MAG: vWA domain-containing protein [Gammaproteobacteria bacterium]